MIGAMVYQYVAIGIIAVLVVGVVVTLILRAITRSRRSRRRTIAQQQRQRARGERGGLFGRRRENRPKLLQNWVETHIADEDLKTWFRNLSKKDAQGLLEDLTLFCDKHAFQLDWVLTESLAVDPFLYEEMQGAITRQLESYYVMGQNGERTAQFRLYQDLLKAPTNDTNLALVQNLYTELVLRDLAPTTPPNLILSSDKDRQKYSLERIQEAATADWEQFSDALQTVLRGEGAAADVEAAGEAPARSNRRRVAAATA
ncbi:MAG: hypothetical protein GYB67_10775 [Chloroflexi bacterium]|nr:hypothetical protein [Chloroflexota bacterium]